MSFEIKETEYLNFGKCLSVSNGIIEALVTIDFGPRIISFGFVEGENVLYTDSERTFLHEEEPILERYGRDQKYYNYGGHRLWTSPERMPESYYPDNRPVVYAILPESVSFTPPAQEENGLALSMELIMADGARDMMVVHSLQNIAKEPLLEGISGNTMMKPGGILVIPQNVNETSVYLPNRSYALWPYSSINDSRITFGDRFIMLKQDENATSPYRIGTNNYSNWAAYQNLQTLLVKHYVHNKSARYPDFNSSFEAYTDRRMMEIKTLSPLYHVQPKETIRHVENWSLHQLKENVSLTSDDAIQAMLDSL